MKEFKIVALTEDGSFEPAILNSSKHLCCNVYSSFERAERALNRIKEDCEQDLIIVSRIVTEWELEEQ